MIDVKPVKLEEFAMLKRARINGMEHALALGRDERAANNDQIVDHGHAVLNVDHLLIAGQLVDQVAFAGDPVDRHAQAHDADVRHF